MRKLYSGEGHEVMAFCSMSGTLPRAQAETLRPRHTLTRGKRKLPLFLLFLAMLMRTCQTFLCLLQPLLFDLSRASRWSSSFALLPCCRTACIANPIGFPPWVISGWISEMTPFWICGFPRSLDRSFSPMMWLWVLLGPCLPRTLSAVEADFEPWLLECRPTLVKALVWHWYSESHTTTSKFAELLTLKVQRAEGL